MKTKDSVKVSCGGQALDHVPRDGTRTAPTSALVGKPDKRTVEDRAEMSRAAACPLQNLTNEPGMSMKTKDAAK